MFNNIHRPWRLRCKLSRLCSRTIYWWSTGHLSVGEQ